MVPNLSRKVFGILFLVALTAYSLFAFQINLGLDLQGGSRLVYRFDFQEAIERREISAEEDPAQVLQDTAAVFLRRLDSSGLADIPIYPQGDDRIVVEIPKRSDEEVEVIKRTIINQGSLQFRIAVDESDDLARAQEIEKFRTWRTTNPDLAATEFNRLEEKDGGPRAGILWYDLSEKAGAEGGLPGFEGLNAVAVRDEDVLRGVQAGDPDSWVFTGGGLSYAGPANDPQTGFPVVQFEFLEFRKAAFADFTDEYTGRFMAIVLNDEIQSSPTINQRLPGGGIITGGIQGFSPTEVRELVTVLRTGSLKIRPTLESEAFVGPSLGADSVRTGVWSAGVGGIVVLLFMLIYYRLNGVVACAALLFNGAILVGALSFTQATLTLPGIAGLVLTIGMAVDANILIYERVREERRRGREVAQAYKNGYEKAFSAIIDSNLTTLITALILFRVGTGPIRGFAATLSLGILTSMFSALVFSKVLMHVLVFSKPPKITEVHMSRRLFRDPKFDFLGKRRVAFLISAVLIVGGLAAFGTTANQMMGIDFTGGGVARVHLDQPYPIEDVRARLAGPGYSVTRSESRAAATGDQSDTFLVKKQFAADEFDSTAPGSGADATGEAGPAGETGEPVAQVSSLEFFQSDLTQKLDGMLATSDPFGEINTVGQRVSGDIQQKAIQAILLSLIAIVIYLNFRFKEIRYGIAAVVALSHDVLFALGALAVAKMAGLQVEINLEIVAAFLTIIGYSLNDTIVVFDRIRENLPRRTGSFADVINLSVNQSLSRTVLTSITTFFVVAVLFFANLPNHTVLEGFAFAMLIGVVVGTYSTMFVASPMLLFLDRWARKRLVGAPAPTKGAQKGKSSPAAAGA